MRNDHSIALPWAKAVSQALPRLTPATMESCRRHRVDTPLSDCVHLSVRRCCCVGVLIARRSRAPNALLLALLPLSRVACCAECRVCVDVPCRRLPLRACAAKLIHGQGRDPPTCQGLPTHARALRQRHDAYTRLFRPYDARVPAQAEASASTVLRAHCTRSRCTPILRVPRLVHAW